MDIDFEYGYEYDWVKRINESQAINHIVNTMSNVKVKRFLIAAALSWAATLLLNQHHAWAQADAFALAFLPLPNGDRVIADGSLPLPLPGGLGVVPVSIEVLITIFIVVIFGATLILSRWNKHEVEQEAKRWCSHQGWSDLVWHQGCFWAFPPGAVMPLPVPSRPPLDPLVSQEANLLAKLLFLVGLLAVYLVLLPIAVLALRLSQTPMEVFGASLLLLVSLTGLLQVGVNAYDVLLTLKRIQALKRSMR